MADSILTQAATEARPIITQSEQSYLTHDVPAALLINPSATATSLLARIASRLSGARSVLGIVEDTSGLTSDESTALYSVSAALEEAQQLAEELLDRDRKQFQRGEQ